MTAKANTALESAAESMYLSNTDWLIRKQCREIEDARRFNEGRERKLKALTEQNEQLTLENSALRQLLKNHGINPDEEMPVVSDDPN